MLFIFLLGISIVQELEIENNSTRTRTTKELDEKAPTMFDFIFDYSNKTIFSTNIIVK